MSEKLPSNNEYQTHPTEKLNSNPELPISSPENKINEHTEQLESIRHGIEKQALSKESLNQTAETNNTIPTYQHHITKQIKAQTYRATIKNVQKSMPKWQANFSKFIHQQNIESISEMGAKTIARPSGIFAGSLLALTGSVIVIITAKRIGFSITPIIFIVLFIVGFLIGLFIEFTLKTVKKIFSKPHRYHY